jgi:hypothetical protein
VFKFVLGLQVAGIAIILVAGNLLLGWKQLMGAEKDPSTVLAESLDRVKEISVYQYSTVIEVKLDKKLLTVLPGQSIEASVPVICRLGTSNWSIEGKTIQLEYPSLLPQNGCLIDETRYQITRYSRGLELTADGLDLDKLVRQEGLKKAVEMACQPRIKDRAKLVLDEYLQPFRDQGFEIIYGNEKSCPSIKLSPEIVDFSG